MFSHELTYLLMIAVFIIGYSLITIEHMTKVNKAAIALLMAVLCWSLQFGDKTLDVSHHTAALMENLAEISQIIFFLLGALTIVETINMHRGFNLISNFINAKSKRMVLYIMCGIAFFLSAILDNLTTTIVMLTILPKLVNNKEDKWIIGGAIVIAANSGGAWTPIGDVTTTMLWIGGQITTQNVMGSLFLPSLVSAIVPIFLLSFFIKGNIEGKSTEKDEAAEPFSNAILGLGIGSLVFVPMFKMMTGLPPYMGMLFAVCIMWLVTDLAHSQYKNRYHLRLPFVLTKIDWSSTLFFLGILLCIGALEAEDILRDLAILFDNHIGNTNLIALAIGFASAVIDNVPLVAASMSMYDLSRYTQDSTFWHLVAYCAGTGGSMLIIGSAAGVVFMGLEEVNFFWYLRKITLPALAGYITGFLIYFLI